MDGVHIESLQTDNTFLNRIPTLNWIKSQQWGVTLFDPYVIPNVVVTSSHKGQKVWVMPNRCEPSHLSLLLQMDLVLKYSCKQQRCESLSKTPNKKRIPLIMIWNKRNIQWGSHVATCWDVWIILFRSLYSIINRNIYHSLEHVPLMREIFFSSPGARKLPHSGYVGPRYGLNIVWWHH